MLFDLRVFFEDFNAQEASTGMKLEGVNSLSEVDAFVSLYEASVSGLTDAYVLKAEARTRFPSSGRDFVLGQSSSYDRVILLCTNGTDYASFTIPAPRNLIYEQSGPYRNVRVDKGNSGNVLLINALRGLLRETLTPTGLPWPDGEWVAARMVNPT